MPNAKKTTKSDAQNDKIKLAFPDVDPGYKPFGSRVVVQIRSPLKVTKGGIIVTEDTQDVELWNTQIGRIRATGPVAFRKRDTLKAWPEGDWAKPGVFVRIPRYNQDKWWVEYEIKVGEQTIVNKALFMMIDDLDLLGEKTGSPLEGAYTN